MCQQVLLLASFFLIVFSCKIYKKFMHFPDSWDVLYGNAIVNQVFHIR